MEFYYFADDQRLGPVNAAQLRALAANGIITPETVIEAGGRTLPARRIKGLEFAPPVPEPPVPEPAPEPVTVFTPGGAYVETPEPKPTPAPSPVPAPDRARTAARASLEGWVGFLTTIAWIEMIAGVAGGVICFMQSDKHDGLVIAGFGAIIGGLGSAILPLAIASIGRFMLTHHE